MVSAQSAWNNLYIHLLQSTIFGLPEQHQIEQQPTGEPATLFTSTDTSIRPENKT